MHDSNVEALAAEVCTLLEKAKQSLWDQMRLRGLGPTNGWRITEELRHTVAGTQWIFRPVHMREAAPDLHTSVAIDHSGRPVVSE